MNITMLLQLCKAKSYQLFLLFIMEVTNNSLLYWLVRAHMTSSNETVYFFTTKCHGWVTLQKL